MSVDPDGPLASALSKCGVDPVTVSVEWDDLCQEDVLTFSQTAFSQDVLNELASLILTFPSRFAFGSSELHEAFERAVDQAPAMKNVREAAQRQRRDLLLKLGLSDFNAFRPDDETLAAFAVRAELASGFAPGSVLTPTEDGALMVQPLRPESLRFEDMSTLLSLIDRAAPGVRVALIGRESVR